MADFDFYNDKTPVKQFKKPSLPTISAMKTALTTYSSTSYSAQRLRDMSELDLSYACRLHGLTVAGL